MMNAINIALSGLGAATKRLNASASNIANLQTVGSLETGKQAPYTPLTVKQTSQTDGNGNAAGVRSDYTALNPSFVPSYAPDSPFANAEGLIGVPNVDLASEAVNVGLAEITFKANALMIKASEEMADEMLSMFDKEV